MRSHEFRAPYTGSPAGEVRVVRTSRRFGRVYADLPDSTSAQNSSRVAERVALCESDLFGNAARRRIFLAVMGVFQLAAR